MKSIMAISMDSGILLFSDSNLNSIDNRDSLDIIQLSSSLFALYKISCSSSSLKWLLKGDTLVIFRTTTFYKTLSERTTGAKGGILVVTSFDSGFDKDEASNIADRITNLLYRQKIPPNQNLSATSKKSLRSALFDLYHRVMWDCLSKVITSESGDSLSCLSEATDIIVHRATPLPVPPIDSPINTSKIELFETDDDAFGTGTGTGSQSPTQESSKIPTPRFLPQWRRFFRRSSDVRMVPAELKAKAALEEGLAAALGKNKNGLIGTPPEANLAANELPKYTGKYLLVQHGKVTTVEAETANNDSGTSSCCQLITASERDMRKRVSGINQGGKRNIFREHLIVQLIETVEVFTEPPVPLVEPPPVKSLYRDISVLNSKTKAGVKSNVDWTGSELVSESRSGVLGVVTDTDCAVPDTPMYYKVETTGYLDLRILVCSHTAPDSQSNSNGPSPNSTEPLYTDIGGGPFGPLADSARLITSIAAWRHFYIFSLICLRSV